MIIEFFLFIEILDAHTTLTDNNNSIEQVKQGVIRVRDQFEKIHLQKVPQKRDSYSICEEDDKRTRFLTVAFDEETFRSIEVYCMPVMFSSDDTLESLLLVFTGQTFTEFRKVSFFESNDDKTHEKLTKKNFENKIIFTIV